MLQGMSTKHFATLATRDVHTSDHLFLTIDGNTAVFIGQWDLGRPTNHQWELSDTPQVAAPGDDKVQAKDARMANSLSISRPRDLWQAHAACRAAIIEVERDNQKLAGEGYPIPLRMRQMRAAVDAVIRDVIAPHAARLVKIGADCDAAEAQARELFPETGEDDFRAALNDSAIVVRIGELTAADLGTLKNGELPPRLCDARVVLAIRRTPPAAHGLPDDVLEQLYTAHARSVAPQTTAMVEYLRRGVVAARSTVASAVAVCAERAGYTVGEVLDKTGQRAFLADALGGIGRSAMQMRSINTSAVTLK